MGLVPIGGVRQDHERGPLAGEQRGDGSHGDGPAGRVGAAGRRDRVETGIDETEPERGAGGRRLVPTGSATLDFAAERDGHVRDAPSGLARQAER